MNDFLYYEKEPILIENKIEKKIKRFNVLKFLMSIGIKDYKQNPLDCNSFLFIILFIYLIDAVKDAQSVYNKMKDLNFKEENMILLTKKEETTKQGILGKMCELKNKINEKNEKDSICIIYFSGHGIVGVNIQDDITNLLTVDDEKINLLELKEIAKEFNCQHILFGFF